MERIRIFDTTLRDGEQSPGYGMTAAQKLVLARSLDKLGVEWEPTESERAYNEGRSTQVPANPVLRVKGRFSRQLRYGKSELVLER